MSQIIQPLHQPLVYPYWEVFLGFASTSSGVVTFSPFIGNIANRTNDVPVIKPFTTIRFAARMSTTSAGPPVAWIAQLFKNGAVAANALIIAWATRPGVAQTTKLWTDATGLVRTPIDFLRGDYWGITISGAPVDAPECICMMDMWGRFQSAGGPSA
jgi:hypothetical protein